MSGGGKPGTDSFQRCPGDSSAHVLRETRFQKNTEGHGEFVAAGLEKRASVPDHADANLICQSVFYLFYRVDSFSPAPPLSSWPLPPAAASLAA